ncbi:bifunctional 3-deoxy-7-phosphoheptulonate synthase/chorismate mutase type II [uncultured Roseivirga sp.]|uniref:bifunctional 3-deoxy-7-phosphoheptulonate synthase/chorismate mutase type II n=1 Tax=uncultured Roseivirga sp. TaxID=543088 RepID=UPI0030D9108A|tara:strand:+ start:43814 stop:44911 length:1098 start_codon:yes stop_codon:yes gene_type:complete
MTNPPLYRRLDQAKKPLIIAGPCSVENQVQFFATLKNLDLSKIDYIRGGIWKPRTRPGSFEGIGALAFEWVKEAKAEFGIKFATEVATAEHVEIALKNDASMLWLGARTTVNPFTVQEISEALKGVDLPVFVKNPINPDLSLWKGALERLLKCNVKNLGAIHRGFQTFQQNKYRNTPLWQIPMELKGEFPDLPLLCDPSHIGGKRSLISELSQRAMDLDYDGLMIETHIDPDNALSDNAQQLTPSDFNLLLNNLIFRSHTSKDQDFINQLEIIREQIDQADREILEAIATRLSLVEKIGEYKKENNVAIFQISRWKEILQSRPEWAKAMNLDPEFIRELYRHIHQQSVRIQTSVFNTEQDKQPND